MADQTTSKHPGNLMMLVRETTAETLRIRHFYRGGEKGRGTTTH